MLECALRDRGPAGCSDSGVRRRAASGNGHWLHTCQCAVRFTKEQLGVPHGVFRQVAPSCDERVDRFLDGVQTAPAASGWKTTMRAFLPTRPGAESLAGRRYGGPRRRGTQGQGESPDVDIDPARRWIRPTAADPHGSGFGALPSGRPLTTCGTHAGLQPQGTGALVKRAGCRVSPFLRRASRYDRRHLRGEAAVPAAAAPVRCRDRNPAGRRVGRRSSRRGPQRGRCR